MSTNNKSQKQSKDDNFYEACDKILEAVLTSKQEFGLSSNELLFALNLVTLMFNGTNCIGVDETVRHMEELCKGIGNVKAAKEAFGEGDE